MNCLHLTRHIIETCTEVYPHANTWETGKRTGINDWEYEEILTEIYEMLEVDESLSVDDLEFMYGRYYPELGRKDYERIYMDYHELKRMEEQDYGMQTLRSQEVCC